VDEVNLRKGKSRTIGEKREELETIQSLIIFNSSDTRRTTYRSTKIYQSGQGGQISVITVEELEKQYLQDFNACRRDLRLPSSVLHGV